MSGTRRRAAARRADPRRRVGVGTRHPGPVTRAAQRRPGCGHPVPGGDRPPRAQLHRGPSRPRPPGVRRMASPRAAASGSARAPGPRSTTCASYSPSSASAPAGSSGTAWRWRNRTAHRLRASPGTAGSGRGPRWGLRQIRRRQLARSRPCEVRGRRGRAAGIRPDPRRWDEPGLAQDLTGPLARCALSSRWLSPQAGTGYGVTAAPCTTVTTSTPTASSPPPASSPDLPEPGRHQGRPACLPTGSPGPGRRRADPPVRARNPELRPAHILCGPLRGSEASWPVRPGH